MVTSVPRHLGQIHELLWASVFSSVKWGNNRATTSLGLRAVVAALEARRDCHCPSSLADTWCLSSRLPHSLSCSPANPGLSSQPQSHRQIGAISRSLSHSHYRSQVLQGQLLVFLVLYPQQYQAQSQVFKWCIMGARGMKEGVEWT